MTDNFIGNVVYCDRPRLYEERCKQAERMDANVPYHGTMNIKPNTGTQIRPLKSQTDVEDRIMCGRSSLSVYTQTDTHSALIKAISRLEEHYSKLKCTLRPLILKCSVE